LLRAKAGLREQESRHELELQKWQYKSDELSQEVHKAALTNKALMQKELALEERLTEMKRALELFRAS
jgi:hypothetical protein